MESKRLLRKISIILLSWCLLISMLGGLQPVHADGAGKGLVTVSEAVEDAAGYILEADGDALTDWDAYALAKASIPVPASYLASVAAELEQNGGVYSNVTDYARIALAVKAAGGNPEQITAGSRSYNLIQSIYNSSVLTAQGTNGAAYSLMALTSGAYNIPLTAKWSPDKIVTWLLAQQNANGGWPLAAGGASSVDITASAIQALTSYRALVGEANVTSSFNEAITDGIDWLSSVQLTNGGFSEVQAGENAESSAQVILALSAAGTDARSADFTQSGGTPLSYLFKYRQSDGGFAHVTGGSSNAGATGQVLMALSAYDAFTGGNSGSYEAVLTTGDGQSSSPASVKVHVVGPDGILADGESVTSNAYDAVVDVLEGAGVSYESSNYFMNSVGGINGTSSNYWLYNVKRQGSWDYANTTQLGLKDYQLHNGDEIYLYYGGSDTTLVDSITVEDPATQEPTLPVAGEAFQVNVLQSSLIWDASWNYTEDVSVAANVYVELGGHKVKTDPNGNALFPSGLPSGTYQAVVSGYREGMAPKIVTDSKSVQIGSATVQIEGSSSRFAMGTASSPNLLDSIENLLTDNHVPYHVENASFGKYIQSIGEDANSWSYAIYRLGKWQMGQVSMADYTLQPGDLAVIYYSGYDANWNPTTYLVDSVSLNPAEPKANQSFTVTVNKTSGYDSPSRAADIQVKIGNVTETTNSQGTASFGGLPEGTYTLDISGYVAGGSPTIVHTTQTVTIQAADVDTGGGTGPATPPVVKLSVKGDSSLGTFFPAANVPLESGDTPYSILVRTLGSDRVQATGSGSTAYVQGIDGLMEFDRGPLSGWMYAINGNYLSAGADSTYLNVGDRVDWRYTLDGGKDLNAAYTADSTAAVSTGLGYAEVTNTTAGLGFSYNNQKPISEIAKPAVVINADQIMSADDADALKKKLAANHVDLKDEAAADADTTITDTESEIQLYVPSGALKEDTEMTVKELSSTERNELVSPIYEFGPSGLSFNKPVQISIETPLTAAVLNQLALVWLNEQMGQWIPIPAVVDAKTGTVTGLVNHFTKFAVIDKSKVASAPAAALDVGPAIERAASWLKGGSELSDWSAYALSRAGAAIPADYLASVSTMLQEKNGTFRNVTDYERLSLSVQAAGGNPESVGGYHLIERIYNNERMEVQGSNGPIYGLLALNGGNYPIPSDAKWTTGKLLQWILDVQNADGSWPLVKGETGNPDLTGAALAALTPYKGQAAVNAAMEKAVKWLGSQQKEDGGFALEGVENVESTAQVIWGLAVSGTDPVNSPYFKSGDSSMLAYLLHQQLSSGAFPHTSGGAAEVMATEQALMALGAYRTYLSPTHVEPPAPANGTYVDEADIASWALPFVKKAAAYGIMEGTGGAIPSFEPQKQITRVQFTAILLRIVGEEAAAETQTGFSDVAPESWYAGYVTKAVAKGIVQGVNEHQFAPDAPVTRQEMAIMLARALHLQAASTSAAVPFADLGEAYPEADAFIQTVAEKGLMEGDDAGQFRPLDSATRQMAAVVAVRAYELTKVK